MLKASDLNAFTLLILIGLLSPAKATELSTVKDKINNERYAFTSPLRNISEALLDDFYLGQSFFKLPWVSAPASTTARDGLGPIFNANSCQSCHIRNGRGRLPEADQKISSALIRLSIAQKINPVMRPDPVYGSQLQPYAFNKIGEATPRFSYHQVSGKFADGEPYTLMKPILSITEWQYGTPDSSLETSIRVAPALIGMGFLSAIPDSAILANSDPEDANNDGISGRANIVWNVQKQLFTVGRLGWKANQPNLVQQVASAFRNDMGITSEIFPKQPCTKLQADCLRYPHGGKPEIPHKIFEKVVNYVALLAIPKHRITQDSLVRQGQQIFGRLQCGVCHRPKMKTGSHTIPQLSNQWIVPYTDLLLHNMGEGLADHRPDFAANGKEWRTAPLWGIGLVEKVNGHQRFLHDGRARGLMEAILWHGGEAENAKQQVLKLSKQQRQSLLVFLKSL
jgi:CxxC motif-containing protein (DUF1111 family)